MQFENDTEKLSKRNKTKNYLNKQFEKKKYV